ncbi:MAG TPA: MAPEG family protein [Povalibacter sp.]|nr:MAPEG family protein [Povalibacter sp.]
MHYVAIVTVLALLEFWWFGMLVGRARAKYGIAAPAMSGNELFERQFRIHMNTLEQLIVFLPALWLFAHYLNPVWAATLGAVFIVGRAVYATSYVRDPKSRSLGFGLSALPTLLLLIGVLWGAIRAIVAGG